MRYFTLKFSFFLVLIALPLWIYAGATINNFHARLENGLIVLEWNTESEINVNHFEIQRSTDKINWMKTGTVKSNTGTSNVRQYYQFSENAIFKMNTSSLNYRLVVVDNQNNREIYSVVASVSGSSGIKRTWGSLKAMFR
jgi:hypothetical protein